MSAFAIWGAVEIGLVFAFVGLGVYLAFRILDFPDLTVDGSFPLGAGLCAVLIVAGVNPWLATGAAMVGGACAGLVTAFLNVRFKILHLLASILTMIALYSINLRIMGRPNVPLLRRETILTPLLGGSVPDYIVKPLFLLVLVAIAVAGLAWFLTSDFGLAMRATGANPRMARAQGVRTSRQIYTGMALSNALVGLAGALFAQTNGFADVTAGAGTIVVGLAAVIVGETILRFRIMAFVLIGCVLGSVLYRGALQLALQAPEVCLPAFIRDGVPFLANACFKPNPSDLNIVTALLVALALILPRLRRGGVAA